MSMDPPYRTATRQTSLHQRPGALNAADMVELRRLNVAIPFFLLMGMGDDDDACAVGAEGGGEGSGDADVMEFGMLHAMCAREELLAPRHVDRAPVLRLARSIASIDDCDAYHNFRCLKADMPRLMAALGFPAVVRVENGSTFNGEEAFLLLLMRMR